MKFNRRGFFKSAAVAPLAVQTALTSAATIPATTAGIMAALPSTGPLVFKGIGEIQVLDVVQQIFRFKGPAGLIQWFRDGSLHREDGPAVEWADGSKEWWSNGYRHREDGPAIEYTSGTKEWYQNGERHRTDGPAIEYAYGTKEWLINGKRHREDGPAIEWVSGRKEWYSNGKYHRVDGPAIEYSNGTKHWYLNGQHIPESVFPFAKPKLLTLVPNVALTSARAQRLALGLTLRSFCKLNNLDPIEQRQLERAEEPQLQLTNQDNQS